MSVIAVTILVLAGVVLLAAIRARLWLWTASTGLLLLGVALVTGSLSPLGTVAWLLLATFNIPAVRYRVFSGPLLGMFRKALPAMSATEREALEAGTVWWDAELFSGRPDWRRLLDSPKPALSPEEQAFLDGPTNELCGMLDDWYIGHQLRDLPAEVWQFIKDQGFFGLIIAPEHGGKGFSAQAHSAIVSMVSTRSITAAVTIMVPNSLGPAELLHRYGTQQQKDHYLPRLASGQEIPCFALTGPEAGSDAASMPDRGVVCYGEHAGERVLGLRLSWEKRYITLAPVATVLGLAIRVVDPDHLLGDDDVPGITLALVPASHPGVEIGRRHYPSSQAFMNGPTTGKDVFVPMDWVIGGPQRVGQGWRMLMNCLAAGRAISLPAMGTSAAKMSARLTGAYARIRRQFKLPIGYLEGVEEPLARIAGQAYGLESARRLTAAAIDDGHEPSVISAMLKYRATEGMRQALNDAMDVHGGRAICGGPSNYLSSAYQGIPVAITVEGANILTRSMIVFGQGALRCHPWLFKEIEAARDSDQQQSLVAFDIALRGHLSYTFANLARAWVHNATAGRLLRAPANAGNAHWFRQATRATISFSLVADLTLLTLGGALKRREKLSGRFADILSELYIMSATLKRFEDEDRPAADQPLVDYVCANTLHLVQERLDGIIQNLPVRPLAWLLRATVFPWGMRRKAVADELGHRVARLLLAPSATRDRLTAGVYVSNDAEDVTGRMEYALNLVVEAEPLERRLREAQRRGQLQDDDGDLTAAGLQAGIIDDREADLLQRTRAAVRAAIMVDDFAPEALAPGNTATNLRSVEAA